MVTLKRLGLQHHGALGLVQGGQLAQPVVHGAHRRPGLGAAAGGGGGHGGGGAAAGAGGGGTVYRKRPAAPRVLGVSRVFLSEVLQQLRDGVEPRPGPRRRRGGRGGGGWRRRG